MEFYIAGIGILDRFDLVTDDLHVRIWPVFLGDAFLVSGLSKVIVL